MLLDAARSLVILVDVQEKLTPLVQEHGRLVSHCHWLLEIAQLMSIPILVSEQYPQGLGKTVKALQKFIDKDNHLAKVHFSCVEDTEGWSMIKKAKRDQIVLIGIEAHVCILQTAMKLREKSLDVFVVADAIASRTTLDKELALKRMQHHGIDIISCEMAVFEWLNKSDTEIFKTISKKYLR